MKIISQRMDIIESPNQLRLTIRDIFSIENPRRRN